MSFRTLALAVPVVLLVASAAACGDDGSSTGTTGGAGGEDSGCGTQVTPVANSEFCKEGSALNCNLVSGATPNQMCNVALKTAPAELARATDTDEFAGQGAPNVACYAAASYPPPPPASAAVDLTGYVRIFSNGCESNDVTIEVFNVLEDGQLGALVGSAVTTPGDCEETGGEQSEVDDCQARWECAYTYPGVPTETSLAVKTSGANWQTLIAYNIYVPTAEVVDGAYDYDPRSLSTDDYGVIAQAAIGHPIAPGSGAIAGEVHDCDDVRVLNAVADTNVPKLGLVYFTSDEDNPLPDVNAQATSRLGLYAALDVKPGPATVAAAGLVNGQMVALGEHKIYVYPDTVSSLTFRGMRPYQVPATTP
jgi:hypothetical protein